jgi:Protein of unknown function (DUF1572)
MKNTSKEFLETAIKRLKYYKELGEKTFAQLDEKDFHFQPNEASNSIAVIIQHLKGNMLSRWTHFLTEDGEKVWRDRDTEFEFHDYSGLELIDQWNKGWDCFFNSLESLKEDDLMKTIYIRTEPLSVMDAINRQLAHYPYHIGQIVYIGRLIKDSAWNNLSIPKTSSAHSKREIAK